MDLYSPIGFFRWKKPKIVSEAFWETEWTENHCPIHFF